MRFNDRAYALLDIPDLPSEAFKHCGDRRIKPQGGGGGPPPPTDQTVTQTSIPDYAKPYVETMLGKTEALSTTPYQTYDRERTAGFTPMQQQAFQGAQGMQTSGATRFGASLAGAAGLGALRTNYQGGQFSNQYQGTGPYQGGQFQNQFQAPGQYDPSQVSMERAQAPSLQQYSMGPAQQVETQSFAAPGSADAYMSPYMQRVVDIQQREAQRQGDIASTQRGAQATQSGAFGGSRQAIMDAEAARNLATQKGDIQATGSQAAYQQAQQQFNAEQAARLQAQQANQQAGLTTGQANLQSQLGTQQLGSGQSMQAQLANQQAGLSAQQLAEQSRQYGAGYAMTGAQNTAQYGQAAQQAAEQSRQYGASQAARQAEMSAQYGQAAQQAAEQSRQFGANLGLQGLNTALQGAGQLGTLGGQQFAQGMDINKLQQSYGTQQQQQDQNIMSQQYQDFLNQQNYPYKQLGFMSDMVRGLPLSQSSSQMYQQPPSMVNQLAGLGTAAIGASKLMAKGGSVNDSQRPAGLAELAISRMA
jgi:hypothetical protein